MKTVSMLIITFIACYLIACAAGCAPHHPPVAMPESLAQHVTDTPKALIPVAHGLDVLIILSIIVIGVAVAVFFLAPTGHALSFAVAAGAGTVEIASLALRVSLWTIPWIAGGLGAFSAILLLYEIYENRQGIQSVIAAEIKKA